MKTLILSFLFTLTVSVSGIGQEGDDSRFTSVGFVTSIESGHLEQSRKLFIHLPDDFVEESSYPLVVLLDGEATFRAFASATALMGWQDLIPDCIVVGIPNINREMDYAPVIEGIPGSGTAEKMLAFYRDELFPFLEDRYPIGMKILYGHSWVGFFTTYVMLKEPSLFDAYISSSPMFRFYRQIFKPEGLFQALEAESVHYYLTLGSGEVQSRELEEFTLLLEKAAPASLQWKFMLNQGKNHDSNALSSYMDGLEFVFR
jgi:predicted alpha/beta superfamily hydrolase